jgi:hypothetical protein
MATGPGRFCVIEAKELDDVADGQGQSAAVVAPAKGSPANWPLLTLDPSAALQTRRRAPRRLP